MFLVLRGTPATVDVELDSVVRGIRCGLAQGTEEGGIELGDTRNVVSEDRRTVEDRAVSLAKRTSGRAAKATVLAVEDEGAVEDEDAGNWSPRAAAIAATTTSRPATRILRTRIRRVIVRAGSP